MSQKESGAVKWKYPNLPPKLFVFSRKVSHLDEINPQSSLNQSQLRGMYNLAAIFGLIFLLTQPVVNFIDHGFFLDTTLYHTFKVDLWFCLLTWPLFFSWSFTSYMLQRLIIAGLSPILALLLQHLTQSGLFIYSIYVIMVHDWCSTHTAFVILQACVHFMKMHSYITVNRDLRQDFQDAKKEGRQPRSNYPNNVSLSDFVLFMWTPWLVYAQYPRRNKIDWIYVVRKGAMMVSILLIMYLLHSKYIQPWVEQGEQVGIVELIIRLMLPSTAFCMLGFWLVFENMCNFFAEITRLDHRQFYQDFWNSTTYQEFNRKWNKPVHMFLYRHCYIEATVRFGKSKIEAQIFTFAFSAALHELLLAIMFRIIRLIMVGFMLVQIPLIYFTKWMVKQRSGLYFFWLGLITGPSMIICFYLRAHQEVTQMFTKQEIV